MPNATPPAARATSALQTLLSDPERPNHPRIWTPSCPPANLQGRTLEARRQEYAQSIQAYRNQVRDLAQTAGIEVIWVTCTLWGEKTIEPV